MDISSIASAEQAKAVADAMMSGMRQLRDAPFYKFSRDDLLETGRMLESLSRALYAAQVRWVGEVEDSGVAAELSCSSTRVLLRDVLRISSGDAADRVRAAKLTQQREPISGGEIPPQLPIVGAALDAGDIGQGHVAVITKAFTGWPRTVDQHTADQVEQLLVDQAQEIDPGQLNKVAQRLDDIMNPDGHAPDERDPASRTEFRVGTRNAHTGLTPFAGTFTDEGVEIFRQATFALAKPVPDDNGVRDPRSPANRLAQAHVEVLRAYLDAGSGSSVGGHVPHVTMTINFDTLTRQLSDATLSHGGPVSVGMARRILCDARILPAVLNGASTILDVGRSQRLFPPHLRDALVLRDGGCAWPGCDRPAGMTQAHHITSWLDGGPTSLANGVLLCLYHHQQAHSTQWNDPDRARWTTRIHPPTMDRPPPTTPPKPSPPPTAAINRSFEGTTHRGGDRVRPCPS